jgi:uncharacterized protein YcnI
VTRWLARLVAALLAAWALSCWAAPASAHVAVSPVVERRGAVAEFTFSAENEREDKGSASLQVAFPADTPMPLVEAPAHPGWSFTVTRAPLKSPVTVEGEVVTAGVTAMTWTADSPDAQTGPGETERLTVRLGPLPATDTLVMKALQTYADGEVVRWIQLPDSSGEEPERPAPVVVLTGPGGTPATSTAPQAAHPDDGRSPVPLAAAGAGVAALALVAGAFLLRARRRTRLPE